jgi:hypothetical protein
MRLTMFRMSACQFHCLCLSVINQSRDNRVSHFLDDRISEYMYLSFLFVLRSVVELKLEPQEPELFASVEPESECVPDPVPEE